MFRQHLSFCYLEELQGKEGSRGRENQEQCSTWQQRPPVKWLWSDPVSLRCCLREVLSVWRGNTVQLAAQRIQYGEASRHHQHSLLSKVTCGLGGSEGSHDPPHDRGLCEHAGIEPACPTSLSTKCSLCSPFRHGDRPLSVCCSAVCSSVRWWGEPRQVSIGRTRPLHSMHQTQFVHGAVVLCIMYMHLVSVCVYDFFFSLLHLFRCSQIPLRN